MSHRINLLFISYITSLSVTCILGVTPARASVSSNPASPSTVHNVAMQSDGFRGMLAQASGDSSESSEEPSSEESSSDESSPDENDSILKLGSRGERVSELQEILQKLGYYDSKPDGIFGDQTKSAVIEFQRQAELPVDGQVGTTTLERLQEAITASDSEIGSAASSQASPTVTAEESDETGNEAIAISRSNRGQFWRMAALIATSAAVAFALYRYTRPRIKRLSPSKLPTASLDENGAERSPTESVATPTQVAETTPIAHVESSNGVSANGASAGTPTNGVSNGIPSNGVPSNGVTGVTISSEPEAIPVEISPLNETTRLAKVDIVDELIDDLRSPDPVKRRKAIWELGQVGDSKAVQPLVDLLMDADSSQRSLILAAISEIGVRTLKPMNRALLLSLQDHSSDVRKNAIRDVTRVYDLISQMSELLAHAASDPDAEVQETARWALGQLGRIRAVPELGSGASLSSKAPEHLPGDV